ncbi:oxidoreductase [Basidiobolus meristosporus CBS 931.73]|uniref:Ceramide very long chain fatty acid hydroxylase n=1 Tax=Basidiobolus meristosporus CBS 931.73 TaxID=1314790 RepID=A0A1Y1YQ14_9FUNG|nr:oxidoreductase [Basidiobolus meristosporus CBS 931.73]|eukprot:ORX99913.1 oxidoreductase [Basidiobolus meristosporus CBS 931.73]
MTTPKHYTASEVATHSTEKSAWVCYKNKVYDVTSFLSSHPGGDDVILEYAGKDITKVLADIDIHEHSEAAYEMLEDLCIGELPSSERRDPTNGYLSEGLVNRRPQPGIFAPDVDVTGDTDATKDFQKQHFLDLNKPLVSQIWNNNFTREFYLKQVHTPRHLPQPAIFFTNPILEMFTRTPWYVIPIIWFPISMYFLSSAAKIASLQWAMSCFVFGVTLWTLLEYIIHRFLFHLDENIPDHPKVFIVHFLLHGVHHYLPMDRLRLVMPPALSFTLATPLVRLAYALFNSGTAEGVISGALFGYMCYDLIHYHLHHARPFTDYLRLMKTFHLDHHYKNYQVNYGITNMIWDLFFSTSI